MRAEHHFLVDGVDADADRLMRAGESDRLAFPEDVAARARMNAGEQFDQRRFAGAVLADDGVNFALFEREVDGLQRVGGAETFVELLQREERNRAGAWRCVGAIGLHRLPPYASRSRAKCGIEQIAAGLSWPSKL